MLKIIGSKSKIIETLVFDFDDTLYISTEDMWDSVRGELLSTAYGRKIEIGSDEYNKYISDGNHPDIGWFEAYKKIGGDPKVFGTIAQNFSKIDYVSYDRALADMIPALREHVREIIVFSGSFNKPIKEALMKILGESFSAIDLIVGTDDIPGDTSKPMKEAYEYLINTYGLNVDKVLFIDDQIKEVNVARELGVNCVLVGERHNGKKEGLLPGIMHVESVYDLHEVVEMD